MARSAAMTTMPIPWRSSRTTIEITSPEQVQIYEPVMHDVYGVVTTELLLAASYVKDNRLLPTGFDKETVPDDIAPQGTARLDADFVGGTDSVTYRIETGEAQGPFAVDVRLLYQSIGYRWAQNVSAFDTEEAQRFSAYYGALPNLPVVVAAQSAIEQLGLAGSFRDGLCAMAQRTIDAGSGGG